MTRVEYMLFNALHYTNPASFITLSFCFRQINEIKFIQEKKSKKWKHMPIVTLFIRERHNKQSSTQHIIILKLTKLLGKTLPTVAKLPKDFNITKDIILFVFCSNFICSFVSFSLRRSNNPSWKIHTNRTICSLPWYVLTYVQLFNANYTRWVWLLFRKIWFKPIKKSQSKYFVEIH